MSHVIKNATQESKVYYGLHFAEGIAEYQPPDQDAYKVFINQDTAKRMNPTFVGKPVYVNHVAKVDLKDIHEADGFVIESFFNKADGRHWCKFIAISDAAHEAIAKGWKLSNAYLPTRKDVGGKWHGTDYKEEITDGVYEHLAIVSNPRYAESEILNPEQFKKYNADREKELEILSNSQGDAPVLKFFKREIVTNSADYESLMVVLPKSKKEFTIAALVNEADDLMVRNIAGYAAPEHMVKMSDGEMSVEDMMNDYCSMKKANSEREEAEKKAKEDMKKENESVDDKDGSKKENEEKDEEDKKKKENEDKDKEDKKENDLETPMSAAEKAARAKFFNSLHDAPKKGVVKQNVVNLSGVELGKARYGV